MIRVGADDDKPAGDAASDPAATQAYGPIGPQESEPPATQAFDPTATQAFDPTATQESEPSVTQGSDPAAEPGPGTDPTPDIVPGIVLDNRYRLEELLGRGATAEVYRATDELLGRSVAVKVFHRGIGDATTVARQRTEMQVLAKLHHPHLVTVYDARWVSTTVLELPATTT